MFTLTNFSVIYNDISAILSFSFSPFVVVVYKVKLLNYFIKSIFILDTVGKDRKIDLTKRRGMEDPGGRSFYIENLPLSPFYKRLGYFHSTVEGS